MRKVKDTIATPDAASVEGADAIVDVAVDTNDAVSTSDAPDLGSTVDSPGSNLPTDTNTGFWKKIKSFLLQEVEEDNFWFKKITLEPAPVVDGKSKSFLFRNITLR